MSERGPRPLVLSVLVALLPLLVAATGAAAREPASVDIPPDDPLQRDLLRLSLRDGDDEEVALIRDLAELGPDSRHALAESLIEASFVLQVEGVEEVEEEIEIRSFRVRTRQGVRSFQTLRDEWPRRMPGGGVLMRDVAGDLYFIPSPASLDEKSRKLLWAYLD